MSLFTTDGFYSAVANRNVPDVVVVRSSMREDAERLIDAIGSGEVLETPERDSRYRVLVHRADWTGYVAQAVEAIDYPNFKSEVARRQGPERARTYSDVWSVMHDLQRRGSRGWPDSPSYVSRDEGLAR